jgi:signal peptidase complex subunit 1
MDYQGQKISELIFYWVIIIFGAIGWVIGYFHQDFSYVFYPWLSGVAIATVLCVPDWPFYNRHPIKWLDSVPERRRKLA